MKCPVCDKDSAAGAVFCQHCGAKLPEGTEETLAASRATARQAPAAEETGTSGRGGRISDTPEETLWEGTYSPKAMLGTFILCGLLSIALLIAALLFATTAVFGAVLLGAIVVIWVAAAMRLAANRLGKSYRLTNQMFYHREGLMTRTIDRIELIEIHDVTWKQGIFQRIVDVGTVIITSADRTHGKLNLEGIEHVESVAGHIDKARRAEQIRRGRRIDFSNIDHQT